MTIAATRDLRPELKFRVGVTGRRRLAAPAFAPIEAALASVFRLIDAELAALAKSAEARRLYRSTAKPRLRVVSPLAEGADRLVARAGLAVGAELAAPLPFAASEYEKDFPQSVAEFRDLLSQARAFALDGARDGGEAQVESYVAVGQFVVRNCDLLIAVWDGEPGGRGGAADIVAFAVRSGAPVLWVDAMGAAPPRWLSRARDLDRPDQAPSGPEALNALAGLIRAVVLPAPEPPPEPEGIFDRIAAWRRREGAPLERFLAPPPAPLPKIFHAYDALLGAFHRSATTPRALGAAEGGLETYWRERYEAADHISAAAAERYRSSYVGIAALVVLGLTLPAFSGPGLIGAGVEFVLTAAIAALVVANHRAGWHERWIAHRLFAELCRKQYSVCRLGRSLPGGDVTGLSEADGEPPREAWVAWAFMAALRGAEFPTGEIAAAKARALVVARELVDAQLDYHRGRLNRMRALGFGLERLAEGLFFALILIVALKAGASLLSRAGVCCQALADDSESGLLFALGVFASAAAGATVAIRAYGEFAMLARQSGFMLRLMEQAHEELDSVAFSLDAPLGSERLARASSNVTAAMLQDLTGWAHLFRIKTIEAG